MAVQFPQASTLDSSARLTAFNQHWHSRNLPLRLDSGCLIQFFVLFIQQKPNARHHPPRRDAAGSKPCIKDSLIRGRVHAFVRRGVRALRLPFTAQILSALSLFAAVHPVARPIKISISNRQKHLRQCTGLTLVLKRSYAVLHLLVESTPPNKGMHPTANQRACHR